MELLPVFPVYLALSKAIHNHTLGNIQTVMLPIPSLRRSRLTFIVVILVLETELRYMVVDRLDAKSK